MPFGAPSVTGVSILGAMSAENVRMGKKITAAREHRGWSKADLARKAGVAPSYVTRVEQGAFGRPSIDLIARIADALSMSVADFVELEPVPALVDLRAALIARGFRADETHVVDQILADLAQQNDDQRSQVLDAVATLLALRKRDTNG